MPCWPLTASTPARTPMPMNKQAAGESSERAEERGQPARRTEEPRLEHADAVPDDRVRERVETERGRQEEVEPEASGEADDRTGLGPFVVTDRERDEQAEIGHHVEQPQMREDRHLDDHDDEHERGEARGARHAARRRGRSRRGRRRAGNGRRRSGRGRGRGGGQHRSRRSRRPQQHGEMLQRADVDVRLRSSRSTPVLPGWFVTRRDDTYRQSGREQCRLRRGDDAITDEHLRPRVEVNLEIMRALPARRHAGGRG